MPEWKEEIRKRLVDLKLPPAREAEIQEELAQHLEERYQELLADGITERAAYQTALGELNDDSFLARELGPLERPVTHEPVILGARNKASFLRDTWRDLRYGARVLAKSPGFTLAAILTLALGIGANSAIFSLVNCILLDPLPYSQPGRLVSVWQSYAPPGVLEALRKQARTMELAAFSRASGFNFTAETTERLDGCTVSANLFALLGARPELGRTFRPGEDQPGQDQVVILSHALWQHRFGGDAGVIGRPIEIDGIKRQIVGVMPASFQLPSAAIQLWLPMHLDPTDVGGYWGGWSYPIIGRLKANVTVDQAQAEFKVLVPGIVKLFPWQMPNQWGQENHVIPWQQQMVGEVHSKLFILLGAVGLILLIACANIANLTLARAGARQREVAVRAALGASRSRIARQVLTESLLLGIGGGGVGLVFAMKGLDALKVLLPSDTPRLAAVEIDSHVLLFTLAVSLLAALAFGLAPALRASRPNLEQTLRTDTARTGIGLGRRRLSSMLVVGEVALAMMLVIAAGLLIRTLWRLAQINTGLEASHVISARLTPNDSVCSQNAGRCVNFYRQVLDRLRGLPTVEDAAAVDDVPLGGRVYGVALAVKDHPLPSGDSPFEVWGFTITPEYLRTMGIPLQRGRTFTKSDSSGPSVVLVSASMAKRFWPGQDPVGKQAKPSWQKAWRTVVGVVDDVREYSLVPKWAGDIVGDIYFPYQDGVVSPPLDMTLVVRTKAGSAQASGQLRSVVASVNPHVPVSEVRTMDDI